MFGLQIYLYHLSVYISTFPKRPELRVFCSFVDWGACVCFYDIGCFSKSQCNLHFLKFQVI